VSARLHGGLLAHRGLSRTRRTSRTTACSATRAATGTAAGTTCAATPLPTGATLPTGSLHQAAHGQQQIRCNYHHVKFSGFHDCFLFDIACCNNIISKHPHPADKFKLPTEMAARIDPAQRSHHLSVRWVSM
jgi:hypothetical protein